MPSAENYQFVILGIDPGTRVAGYGCLGSKKLRPQTIKDFEIIDAGVLKISDQKSPGRKMGLIHESFHQLMNEFNPTVCVVEKAFLGANVQSALRLGEVRGSIFAACHRQDVQIEEVAPTRAKKMVAGSGHASKEEISRSLATLIDYKEGLLPFDASDALALALSYAMEAPVLQAIGSHGKILQKNL